MSADTRGKNCFSFLWKFFKIYGWEIFVSLFILTVLVDFVEFFGGNYLLQVIIDKLEGGDILNYRTVFVLLIIFPLIAPISFPTSVLRRKLSFTFTFKSKESVRLHIFQHLLKQPTAFFSENLPGAINSKINSIVDDIPYFVDNSFELLSNLLTLLALVCLFATKNFYLGLTMLILTTLYFFVFYFFAGKMEKKSEIIAEAESNCSGEVMDCLTNIVGIKSFSRENLEKANIKKQTLVILRARSEQQFMRAMVDLFNFLSVCTLLYSMGFMGFSLYRKGSLSLGEFMFVIQTTSSIFWWIKVAAQKFLENTELFAEMNRAMTTLMVPHRISDSPSAKDIVIERGEIEFRNVYFGYDKNKPYVFENLNFIIKANQKVGIVGYSGAGKSTLVSLLMRIYDVSHGNIFIDGYDIKTALTQKSLRKNISYVPQEPTLFHRTLRENIAYGKAGASFDEIKEASLKSNCHEFISKLDDGFNSIVGDRGFKLSGGQKQRIAIAMVVLKNSKILLLDEATSSLDNLTEWEIQDTIRKHMADKTVIIIGHKLSTLNHLDRIIVFNDGRIAEDGSKEELLANRGLFRSMWDMQKDGVLYQG
ncbi:MAG: ABC transporter ATP-binding protein/permease [Rickettsiales bacterium]|jgi:ATP-binding cassette subfamily B protein|nr:ABC transporter ATP-binding protein/permease [Rickettsiales bacterium]